MMTNGEEFAVEPKNKMKRHREQKSPPSSKRSESMAVLSMKEEEFHVGASAMSVEDVDPKVTAMSALEMMSTKIPLRSNETSVDIKQQLRKEIRQFGRKYEGIFKLLEGVQSPLKARKEMVEFAIKEAARFKRRHLIQYLEKILEEIYSDQFSTDNQILNT
ncbi:integrator complex subunit 6-like [Pteropus alecto]|uniref:Protein DDX26B n=1 Tax=Pteropus alecto TaxID=9402 RepID=L5K9U7_PTEAL|nr:integrator complex subunit 6-like [Pteropus alecto]ELK08137.1 Protein DDX26B [Pteropus alecto]